MSKVKVLVVEPKKGLYSKVICDTMTEVYDLVYYPYEKIEIIKNVYVIYSKEAKQSKDIFFQKNRVIRNIEIYGTFVIVCEDNGKIVSLSDKQINEIKNMLSF